MNGIDISVYQSGINFKALDKNILYCYIKATEGVSYVDKAFQEHLNNIKQTNIKYGFYHYFSEKSDPSEQAKDFYNAIRGTGYSLIPVLDIESNVAKRSRSAVTDRALQFLRKFKELSNIDCIVYTYTSFANSYLDNRLSSYKCWIADYNKSQTVKANNVWSNFVGHQYSGSGRIEGYNGQIDLNNFTSNIELNNKATVNTNVATTSKAKIVFNVHLRDFQSAYNKVYGKNILVDGLWGTQSNNAVNSVLLKQGSRNDLVAWVQIRISNKISVDGIFGARTKDAVMQYQKAHKLSVDGIVGANTLKAILKQYGVNI